jgi:hypothetical protein
MDTEIVLPVGEGNLASSMVREPLSSRIEDKVIAAAVWDQMQYWFDCHYKVGLDGKKRARDDVRWRSMDQVLSLANLDKICLPGVGNELNGIEEQELTRRCVVVVDSLWMCDKGKSLKHWYDKQDSLNKFVQSNDSRYNVLLELIEERLDLQLGKSEVMSK